MQFHSENDAKNFYLLLGIATGFGIRRDIGWCILVKDMFDIFHGYVIKRVRGRRNMCKGRIESRS